jgi:hypothetical protein
MPKIIKDIKKLTIQRSKWLRGQTDCRPTGLLLSRTGKMCCLGFYALACGFEEKHIKNIPGPQELQNSFHYRTESVYGGFIKKRKEEIEWDTKLLTSNDENSNLAYSLMDINDNYSMDEETREQEIKQGFLKMGVKVKFED